MILEERKTMDRDLQSIQEVRDLLHEAHKAGNIQ